MKDSKVPWQVAFVFSSHTYNVKQQKNLGTGRGVEWGEEHGGCKGEWRTWVINDVNNHGVCVSVGPEEGRWRARKRDEAHDKIDKQILPLGRSNRCMSIELKGSISPGTFGTLVTFSASDLSWDNSDHRLALGKPQFFWFVVFWWKALTCKSWEATSKWRGGRIFKECGLGSSRCVINIGCLLI